MLIMIVAIAITLILAGILYLKNRKSKERTLNDMKKLYESIEKRVEPVSQKVLKPFYRMLEAPREAFPPLPPYEDKTKK